MKTILAFALGLITCFNLQGQANQIKDLVSQGTELHDQGKYDEAIAKYKAALAIDSNSTLANYELSYTCMTLENYDEAIKYSSKVIEQNSDNQQAAYVVLGTSYDMLGRPEEAIKTYQEGLTKFSGSNLLNYNLALTMYNQKDYDGAEQAAINAIVAKPGHGSSHLILSAAMQAKGQRVKALLPLYYFLMLEPNSKRSAPNYNNLRKMLDQGVEQKGEKNINVTIPSSAAQDSIFGAAEMMVSLTAASKLNDKKKYKTDMDYFADMTKNLFSILGELKKDNTGFWWTFYVPVFYDLEQTDNCEAFCYYISLSAGSDEVNKWLSNNNTKMQKLKEWANK